ncbi:PREDICTED: voltage-dependent T-type calcium channel subunit alpha-1I-like [Myotis brandtii]|uniref:voltage-dependent T-type calcium channel subunit alpha-1I-like n=1 Tax=Myotis brandtii TaxID=109478 RepID=UPI0007045E3C|nr:PREDICTED: voltage-dependent T-type calcium channel subunit alpha-1I-like [Myotis brandtii]
MATGMRALLDTVVQALPQVGNLGLLFMLLFFIYAALGVELFGKLVCNDENPCEGMSRHATFENFGMAFLTLFQVSTGDNWNGIMKDTLRDCTQDERSCLSSLQFVSPLYFVSFVLTAQFVLINVVVAVLMKHLDDSNKEAQEDAEMDAELELEMIATAGPGSHALVLQLRCWTWVMAAPSSPFSPEASSPLLPMPAEFFHPAVSSSQKGQEKGAGAGALPKIALQGSWASLRSPSVNCTLLRQCRWDTGQASLSESTSAWNHAFEAQFSAREEQEERTVESMVQEPVLPPPDTLPTTCEPLGSGTVVPPPESQEPCGDPVCNTKRRNNYMRD